LPVREPFVTTGELPPPQAANANVTRVSHIVARVLNDISEKST
jgi:hypothetical protein